MSYSISRNASGNEVTEYHDLTSCGDFPECHDEDNPCRCVAPVGIVVAVRWNTVREDVVGTIHRIREERARGGQFENLFTNDLRNLLASRHDRGAR